MTVFVFFKKDLKDELINLHIYIRSYLFELPRSLCRQEEK